MIIYKKIIKSLIYCSLFITIFSFNTNLIYAEDISNLHGNFNNDQINNSQEDEYIKITNKTKEIMKDFSNVENLNGLKKIKNKYINDENMTYDHTVIFKKLYNDKLKELKQNIVKDLKNGLAISNFVSGFEKLCKSVGPSLKPISLKLLGILTFLEIIFFMMSNPIELPFSRLGTVILRYGCLYWLINKLPTLANELYSLMKNLAISVTGGTTPSNALEIFYSLSDPIIGIYTTNESFGLFGVGDAILWLAYCLIGLFPLIFVSLIYLECQIIELEFYFITGFCVILLAFYAWEKTKELNKVVSIFATQGAIIFAMYFSLSYFNSKIPSFEGYNFYELKEFFLMLLYTLWLFLLRLTIAKTRSIANALLNGGGTGVTASSVVGTASKIVGGILIGGAMAMNLSTVGGFAKNVIKNGLNKFSNRHSGAANLNSEEDKE